MGSSPVGITNTKTPSLMEGVFVLIRNRGARTREGSLSKKAKSFAFCLQEQRKRLARENAAAFEASLAAVVPSNALHCVVPLGSPLKKVP